MDYKKTTAPSNTVTRDMMSLAEETGNVYETVRIIGKRANEISVDIKRDCNTILVQAERSTSLPKRISITAEAGMDTVPKKILQKNK
jgi:hypothetical protein